MSNDSHPSSMMKTADDPLTAYVEGMAELQNEAVRWMSVGANPQFSGMANLAAHPMGAFAAASAIGMGMASQMLGMMAGTMAGAMKATDMLASENTGGRSEPFGLANPLNFDWATGSFEEKTKAKAPEEKPATKKPAAKKAAPKAAPAPVAEPKREPELVIASAPPIEAEPVAIETVAEAEAGVPVMPEDFVKPKGMARPEQPDDLKAISGVGPKLEQVLNGLGVWTYTQIAGWKPEEVAWVDDTLGFKGRIERDEWIAQAAELAGKGKA